MRLARYFGTTPLFWLGLQDQYDLEVALAEQGRAIEREITPRVVECKTRPDSALVISIRGE